MDISCTERRAAVLLILLLMTSSGHALLPLSTNPSHFPLTAEYRVTSYGSAVQLDCLALRTNTTISQNLLDLSELINPLTPSSSDQAGRESNENMVLPEVGQALGFVHWILPDLSIVNNESSLNEEMDLVRGRDGGVALRIKHVRPHHFGLYLCHAQNHTTSQHVYSSVLLHFVPPPVWREYRGNFIRAFIASGATLLLTTLLCVIHGLRWRPRHDDDGDGEEGKSGVVILGEVGLERHEQVDSQQRKQHEQTQQQQQQKESKQQKKQQSDESLELPTSILGGGSRGVKEGRGGEGGEGRKRGEFGGDASTSM